MGRCVELARVKELLRTAVYKVDYLLLKCFGKMLITKKGIRKVHFSIDNVFDMVEAEHSCIRDDLRRLNTEYGLISHLFLFYNHDGKVLNQIPTSFRNLKCLDYGAHQAEYIDETYERIVDGSVSEYVRLHEFKADPEQLKRLKKHGVEGVLTADSNTRSSYRLSEKDCRRVSSGNIVEEDGIRYLKTDIRLEKIIFYQLMNKPKTDTLVVFTHESKYRLVSKRLNLFCDLLYQADVEFI